MFDSLTALRRANQEAGSHWFSEDMLAHWECEIHGELVQGRYFISSDTWLAGETLVRGPRRWYIQEANAEAFVSTTGNLLGYESLEKARLGLMALLAGEDDDAKAD